MSVQGTPRRGNERIAQGIALGRLAAAIAPCKGKSVSTKRLIPNAFALAGRTSSPQPTQGVALGYELVAPSGRTLNACFPLGTVLFLLAKLELLINSLCLITFNS